MQTSFLVTKAIDQSCFMDIQENNEMIQNRTICYDQATQIQQAPPIQIDELQDEDNQGSSESTKSNENEEQISPYFISTSPTTLNQNKMRLQPFLSSASRDRLILLFKKENYIKFSSLYESSTNLTLKAFNKDMNQYVVLNIFKGMKDDYLQVKEEHEKVKRIYNNQYLLYVYKIVYYEELFVYVIVSEVYESSLQDELYQIQQQKFQYTPNKAYTLLSQLYFGIAELHTNNIVHKNINPLNILKINDGLYKIGGFGTWRNITKQTLQSFTNQINMKFLSPEFLEKLQNPAIELTSKSDVYSLSAIFLDILLEIKQAEPVNQTPKSNITKQKQNYNPQQEQYISYFKKHLLCFNYKKRIYSYELINLIHQFVKPQENCLKETLKHIGKVLSTPQIDYTQNIQYLMNYKLAISDFRINLMKIYQQKLLPWLGIAQVTAESGYLNEEYGLFKKSLERYQEAIEIYKQIKAGSSDEMIDLLRNIAQVYQKLGDYEKYLEFSMKSLEMAEDLYKNANHIQIICSLHYVSWSYYFLKQGQKALEYAEKALHLRQKIKEIHTASNIQTRSQQFQNMAYTLETVGAANQLVGKRDEALRYFQQSLEELKKSAKGNRPDLAASLNNIGVIYEEMEDYQNSLAYFTQASEMYTKIYGNYHPLLLISKKGILRSLQKLNRIEEINQLEKEILNIESHVQKNNN
ncbi:tetratricopeptide repeat protein (macronuclear) [Tetrahymena thermophila SB210]|uniref:Tetratricopeptide repeat protein n=1 Tax=Tetrahymena thermophila (strain SB210) TaxID=312017 RepID=Q22ZD9_TETTS|nr:tetratricopeptide repeat protein [Tetrahymena thermophila SB210]EAR90382.1 tetratricopeptide repeat protein [Tetrahymena thermophila SB210]|eukprot:XP_001010627.1 tetratricopeptide repeat protein [Tetrahymena thermophila SB210]